MQDNKTIPTGVSITDNSDNKAMRVTAHFPEGTIFVGGALMDVYGQLPVVNYFLRMVRFDKDENTMEIIIPYILKSNPVADRASGLDDNDDISNIGPKPKYTCWGDYLIPLK